ncbi:5'-methylthioadenosine/adenosylhomocysteine nucleosidase [Blautia sp. HCP3S3_G3]|uniref:5'-methylthioadenosine/adenosylhomocysteine nucleosidase n=1 Tax=Blautia sp. HCP3S3_G3 TaxID=3438913 RepID=UPI003F89572E
MRCIGIIGAMEQEVLGLKEQMQEVKISRMASMEFFEGILEGKKVVVVKSGIGKVNAAVCTQILVDVFHVEVVINTGVAGSLNNQINIGDIVVSTDVIQHDMDVTPLGYPKGQIPDMEVMSFEADEALRKLALQSCREVNPDIEVFEGRIASGDQFISSQEVKDSIVEHFGAYAAEMEGASIGQAAYLNHVPFLVIRAISDKADGSANVDYPVFEAEAIRHSVKLTSRMIRDLQG